MTKMVKFAERKSIMRLDLSEREMAVVVELADSHDMSKTAVIRAALRLYQLVHIRLREGETLSFSGDKGRSELIFIQPGFGEAPAKGDGKSDDQQ